MPVFKIKKDGAWQEVGGVSGHTHNTSQIIDFPSLSKFATTDYVDTKVGKIPTIESIVSEVLAALPTWTGGSY